MHALETALQLRVNVKLEFAVTNLLHLCLKIQTRQRTFQLSTLAGSVHKGSHTHHAFVIGSRQRPEFVAHVAICGRQ
jgi:hypothetical protein